MNCDIFFCSLYFNYLSLFIYVHEIWFCHFNVIRFSFFFHKVFPFLRYLFSGGVNFNDLSMTHLLELFHISDVILMTKFRDVLEDFLRFQKIPTSGEDLTFLPELISGLKLAEHYNLSSIEACIIEELHHCLWLVIDNSMNRDNSFRSISYESMKKIVLFQKPKDDERRATSTKERFDAFMYWLNDKEISMEEKSVIFESFDFEDFTVDELLSSVKASGYYSTKMIDKRVGYLYRSLDSQVKKQAHKMKKLKEGIKEIGWCFPEDKLLAIERLMDSWM